jgi:cephalosporin-C deacetylase
MDDLNLNDLHRYRSEAEEPRDFDSFWSSTLAAVERFPLSASFTPHDAALAEFDVFDVRFNGWGGQPVAGWLILSKCRRRTPLVVSYVGYGSGRGFPHQWLPFAAAGCSVFVMDTRGQGSEDLPGVTPDSEPGHGPQVPGFVTNGLDDPSHHYYRRVYSDAYRAVDCARSFEGLAESPVVVHGVSQGGGIALAVTGLRSDLTGALIDVPFLMDWPRAIALAESGPYREVVKYLSVHRDRVDESFETLSYFDGVAFARRAGARARFSVALRDSVCPPSTVFAGFNEYAGEKEIRVWPHNDHEGGAGFNLQEQLTWLRSV